MNIDAFCILSVTNAQCVVGTEKKPDAGTMKNYDDDEQIRVMVKLKKFSEL